MILIISEPKGSSSIVSHTEVKMNITQSGDWEYWLRDDNDRIATYRSDLLPTHDELKEVMRRGGVTAEKIYKKIGRIENVYFEVKKSSTFRYDAAKRQFIYTK
jgi:hypothetical protein